MKHLFENIDGEIVAADTAEQACQYCKFEGDTADEWEQIADDAMLPEPVSDGPNYDNMKSAKDWAATYAEPCIQSTTTL